MKDFRLYDVHDFLLDEDFIRWVRLRKKEDEEFWQKWLENNPGKNIMVAEARSIIENFETTEKFIDDEELERNIRQVLNVIGKKHHIPIVSANTRKSSLSLKTLSLAAVLIFLLAVGAWFIWQPAESETYTREYTEAIAAGKLIESVNSTTEVIMLQLPDKSTVKLSPNSRIAYDSDFDSSGSRDVYLIGEAMFAVQKNPSRPFRVFANDIVAKVLGTSFVVRSYGQDSMVHVSVNTGKVGVYLKNGGKQVGKDLEADGIILTPNQELVYQKENRKFRKVLVNNPKMVVREAEDNHLSYDDYPLEKVLRQLTENFGVNILFDSELLGPCTITADLRTVPFYEKLDLICKAIGGKYEIIDGQVVIQASGCN